MSADNSVKQNQLENKPSPRLLNRPRRLTPILLIEGKDDQIRCSQDLGRIKTGDVWASFDETDLLLHPRDNCRKARSLSVTSSSSISSCSELDDDRYWSLQGHSQRRSNVTSLITFEGKDIGRRHSVCVITNVDKEKSNKRNFRPRNTSNTRNGENEKSRAGNGREKSASDVQKWPSRWNSRKSTTCTCGNFHVRYGNDAKTSIGGRPRACSFEDWLAEKALFERCERQRQRATQVAIVLEMETRYRERLSHGMSFETWLESKQQKSKETATKRKEKNSNKGGQQCWMSCCDGNVKDNKEGRERQEEAARKYDEWLKMKFEQEMKHEQELIRRQHLKLRGLRVKKVSKTNAKSEGKSG
eukprot:gene19215-21139_t